ncbi:MAG: hypothetical protein R3B96_02280 [Pirellulaceae bacterium]
MNRHNSMNERVAKGNVDLVFIGDSITQGWEEARAARFGKSSWRAERVNSGYRGGDRTGHVIWRLDNGNFTDITLEGRGDHDRHEQRVEAIVRQIAEGVKVIVGQIRREEPPILRSCCSPLFPALLGRRSTSSNR